MSAQWWDYPSNFSNGLEVNSTGTLMQYVNSVTGGHLGLMLLMVSGVVIFLSLKTTFSAIRAFTAMFIITFLLSIPLAMMEILSWNNTAIFGVLALISTIILRSDSQQGL